MIPTFIGLITVAIGSWLLLRGSILQLLCAMLVMGLFEASAAVVLPSLGGSSIPPPRLMLLFLAAAAIRAMWLRRSLVRDAFGANAAIIVFAVYGALGAFILPYMFAGQINVVPLRPAGLRHLTDTFPLYFSPQNITTAFYILGTALSAVCAYVAVRVAGDIAPLAKATVAITLAHAVTGLAGALLINTPWDLIVNFVRNGSYSQLNQATDSFVRITGFMAEPSNYARFGVVWMILSFELWLRRISSTWTGIAALAMGGVLAVSTSSTAYMGLGAYAVVLAARFSTLPHYADADRILKIALWLIAGAVGVLGLVLFSPPVAAAFADMLDQMTVQKAGSSSGQQRLFWAMQGFDAFVVSGGLGIGAGSFRSSSLITAIIGSMGIIGFASFVAICVSLFLPRKPLADPMRENISRAAAWAALIGLFPAMVMQGSPDPGMEFAVLSGVSLALRLPAMPPLRTQGVTRWGEVNQARLAREIKPRAAPGSAGWRHSAR